MQFKVSTKGKQFSTQLEKAAKLGPGDFRTAFRRISNAWLKEIDSGFVREVDPFGAPWQPLAASTIKEKQRKGVSNPEAILQESGKMRAAWKAKVDRTGFTIFNDRRFPGNRTAAFHQFGGYNTRSNSFVVARPMVPTDGIPDLWATIAEGYLNDDIKNLFK